MKKIVLASDSGGQSEIIQDGINGFLFSHANPDTFREKFLRILTLSRDEYKKIGEGARERVNTLCSYDTVYPEKIRVLKEIVRSGERSYFPFLRPVRVTAEAGPTGYTKSKEGLLSIIIPYYNMGRYIKETLNSLREVTYAPCEVLIINDGSNEAESIGMLYEIEDIYKDLNLRILHKKNEGLASARNFGAHHAEGEFIAFLDSDDLVFPEYYEWAIKILKKYSNVSFVAPWTQYFEGSDNIWPTWNTDPPYILIHNTLTSGGIVIKREDFLNFGINDKRMEYGMEDYESIIRLVRNGRMGVVIPKPLYRYRVRKDSMLRQFNENVYLHLYRIISEINSDIYKDYAVEVFNLLLSNGPPYLYDNPTFEYPRIGFVQQEANVQNLDLSQGEIPYEVKEALKELWRSKIFRVAFKSLFKLRIHKLFLLFK